MYLCQAFPHPVLSGMCVKQLLTNNQPDLKQDLTSSCYQPVLWYTAIFNIFLFHETIRFFFLLMNTR